jgi:hypothetical protein
MVQVSFAMGRWSRLHVSRIAFERTELVGACTTSAGDAVRGAKPVASGLPPLLESGLLHTDRSGVPSMN